MVLKPPPNYWRWDQINFVFSEMGLEMPTPVEEKKTRGGGEGACADAEKG